MNKKKVVVIGGGTGTMSILGGLKQYRDLDISVIVNMTDDGGSNKVVRDEFGLLPLSDLRKSMIALADDESKLLQEIFTYRFDVGEGLRGHTLGNLIMMGLSKMKGSEWTAIRILERLFQLRGRVIPVTELQTNLVATYDDGSIIKSEHLIDEPDEGEPKRITRLGIDPVVPSNPEAMDAIRSADVIVLGPGDLYTTVIAALVIPGIVESIHDSKAKVYFIANLMTKRGQTHGMTATNVVSELEHYIRKDVDHVVLHNNGYPPGTIERYEEQGEKPIADDLDESPKFIRGDIVMNKAIERDKGDTLVRSFIRHDPQKLGRLIYHHIWKD